MESLREMFFEESEELIESLAENLELVSSGDADDETINAIFRSVHSIKGSAGAFGLSDLVSFAHHYETVLDLIRSDKLAIDENVLRLITRSSDNLAELVENARIEGAAPPAVTEQLTNELVEMHAQATGGGAAAPAQVEAPAEPAPAVEFQPIAFEPIGLALVGGTTYEVTFAPRPSFYLSGHEPRNILDALKAAGDAEVVCHWDQTPNLAEFDFDAAYLSWTVKIEGVESEQALHDVFAFAEGHCDLTITASDDEEEADTPEPPKVAAPEVATAPEVPAPSKKPDSKTPEASAPQKSTGSTLRVDSERVDKLINSVGELIINQAVIDRLLTQAGIDKDADVVAAMDDYGVLAREIQEGVMAIRAQPIKSLFQRMGRVVREAGEMAGKKVVFKTTGEGTEIDKTMLERLTDPLTHMLRNAVDHGVESAEERIENGKPETGVVELSALHRSGHVIIEVKDDGKGLIRQKLFDKAVEKGIVSPEAKLSEAETFNLLFAAGFSTAASVTNLSGRGVGMDVVKTSITSLGGKVSISSEPGKGSTFTISLPLTLAVLDGMIVSVGNQRIVLPISNIVETIQPEQTAFKEVSVGEWVYGFRDDFFPVVDLRNFLGLSPEEKASGRGAALLVESAGKILTVLVDDIHDQRQVVIKSLKEHYGTVPGVAAATILGDGQIALIVDPEALATQAIFQPPTMETITREAS